MSAVASSSDVEPLVGGPRAPAELLLRDVHTLDPRAGIDARHDVRVRGGVIAEVGAPGTLPLQGEGGGDGAQELVEGEGRLLLAPGFFDPHVHLRTPGQEHKEDIDSGTRAAAAGGFAGVIAMPNTDPVLDSAPLLRSLRDGAAREARVPVGFLPAITRGLEGEQLTEMAELRGEGALGFTDDGRPVASAGMLRKALQYQRLCGGVLSLHEEDPTLSRGGAMHEGAVSAALGIAGIPSVAESTMVARDAALAGYEDARVHFQHLSTAASVDALAEAKARGFRVSGEVCPHHLLLTEEDVRGLDTRMKMYPPLATEADRVALVEGLRSGMIDCIATDHAPHARDEKEVPFEQAPMGTTGLETRVRSAAHRPRADGCARSFGAARRAYDRGRRAVRAAHAHDRSGAAREPRARGPRRRVGGRRARLGESLGELLLRRAAAAGPGVAHARRRRVAHRDRTLALAGAR